MRRLLALAACALPLAAGADTLTLRDGRVIEGSYRGGTSERVHFEIEGKLHGVPVGDVVSVAFRRAGDPEASAAPAAAAPSVARVAAGTRLRVRLTDTLDPHVNTPGDRFDGVLEMELQAAGATIVPLGSPVSGKITQIDSGPTGGFALELTALQIGEVSQPIVTGSQQSVSAGAGGPAAPAPSADRIPGGTLLEFRLLQPFDVRLR